MLYLKYRNIIIRFTTGIIIYACSCSIVLCQNQLSGIILDSSTKSPLPGATIRNLDLSDSGVTTNFNGAFSIEAGEGDQIEVSYIGYKSYSFFVDDTFKRFEIFLEEDAFEMDNVVVTALGIAREEKSLGYSVQSVDQQVLSNNTSVNFINKLSGQVAGLNISSTSNGPSSSNRILIRGSSSLTGSDQPLFVIDGLIVNSEPGENFGSQDGGIDYGDPLSTINPDDIDSVTVLKGPGATALYGSLGTNGVIVITTKKGSEGENLKVNVSSSMILNQAYIFPHFQNDYGRGSKNTFTKYNSQSYGPAYDGSMFINWLENEIPYSPVFNQMESFFRDATTTSHNLQISGGNSKSQFLLSSSLYDAESIMPNSNIKRQTLNLNYSTEINEKLKFNSKISYFNQDAFNRPNLGGSPDNPVRNFYLMPRSVKLSDLTDYIDESGRVITWDGKTEGSFNQNPYWGINLNTNQDIRDRVIASLDFNYDIFPWLNAIFRAGWDIISDTREKRIAEYTVYKTSPVATFSHSKSNRSISNLDFILSAQKSWDNFDIDLSTGASRIDNSIRSLSSSGDDLVNPDLWVINNFKEIISTQGISDRRLNSLFSTLNGSWKNKLYLNLTYRNDWSSVLPKVNRSFSYWSSNLSWIISNSWKNFPKAIDFAKLRLSVAKVGNANSLTTSALFFNYTPSTGHLGQPFTRLPRIGPNSYIKPESTLAYELGFDFRLFQGRLNIDTSLYQNDSYNQIFTAPVASTTGFQKQWINSGSIRNRGVEIILKSDLINTSNFRWNMIVNGSANDNEVLELSEDLPILILGGSRSGISVQARTNYRSDLLVGSKFLKNESGQYILDEFNLPQIERDENGNSDFILGHVQPDYMIGFINSLDYKNLSIYFSIDSQFGGSIFSSSYAAGSAVGTLQNTIEGRKNWVDSENAREELGYTQQEWIATGGIPMSGVDEDGNQVSVFLEPERYWSRLSGVNQANVFDSSFIRVKEISISYNLPKRYFENLFLESASISVFGSNLGYIMRKTEGFSPQSSLSSGKAQGIESYAFPTTRSIGAKIMINI